MSHLYTFYTKLTFYKQKKASNSLVKIHFVMNSPSAPQKSMTIYLTTETKAWSLSVRGCPVYPG